MGAKIKSMPISKWRFSDASPFVISGPCSAETEEQVMETVKGLAKYPVHAIRAGIWKPRTRPGCFEGVGEQGLRWLKQAGDEVGLPVATEVASPVHVDACLKAGIDILWIGARTTVNPFSVQPLADALKGVDVPVLVKNPINPDIELWIGALERLSNAGITKLAAIHRGFSAYKKSKFRNKPNWKLPIELRRRVPSLPIICDPSHICGNRRLIPEVAQTALDLTFDGLMIESHIHPDSALSDAKQQLTPDALGKLLAALKTRKDVPKDEVVIQQLEGMRRVLDQIDDTLLSLIVQRMEVAKEMGRCKKENNINLFQPKRWKHILTSRVKKGKEAGLSEDFMTRVWQYLHEESIRHQEKV